MQKYQPNKFRIKEKLTYVITESQTEVSKCTIHEKANKKPRHHMKMLFHQKHRKWNTYGTH